ncbi:hypothetical protein ACO2Q9_16265 [Variovorax sp. VNK109]|uniref:hypothetical protein n=1 Tax=Variovorax sp. VNK109 TaxID=3400919 RepID=UPI003C10E64B
MPDSNDPAAFLRATLPAQRAGIARHVTGGRTVWLKKAGPRNPRWRYWLLGALAGAFRLDVLSPVMNLGGEDAIAHEARRLRELAALGLRVPQVLAEQADGLLLSDLGDHRPAGSAGAAPVDTMLGEIAAAARRGPADALFTWKLGLDAIADVHARGSYLSQAFARNLVLCPDGRIGFIDFEDDPGHSLDLAHCQARDWLSYMHSTAMYLVQVDGVAAAVPLWHGVLSREAAEVRQAIDEAAARMRWLRRLPQGPRWGTDTRRLRSAALFFATAAPVQSH